MDLHVEISPALEAAIDQLLRLDAAIIEAGKQAFAEDFFLPDLFIASVLNRALQLLHGFVILARRKNYLSAAPLFRLQLDNALRLWAASMVDNFDVFTTELLDGQRIDKMKSKSGERLTDRHLVRTLSKHLGLPKLVNAYEFSSGYIHLSGQHIFATNHVEQDGRLSGRITRVDDTTSDKDWLDLIDGFSSATSVTLVLIENWIRQKNDERSRRDVGQIPT